VFTLVIITGSPAASADSHDEIVYQRFSRKVTPGKIPYEFGMTFTELTHAGTKADVEKGAAVFTFEGLGPSRVWKLPECPIFCEWPSLKDYPFEGQSDSVETNFDDFGYVCQAEELQINGQWKRYFGFVCNHGTAVVPAEQIYLSLNGLDPTPHRAWIEMPGGLDWGMLGPDAKKLNGTVVPVHLNIGDSLAVELYMRNRRGVPQKILGDIYLDAKNKGPAFRKGINLSLAWAPFDEKTPDRNYPNFDDFKPVGMIRTNFFSATDTGPVLATGETLQRAVCDIRDWFNVTLPGYYRYHFEFSTAELHLPKHERNGGRVYMTFVVGSEPGRLTVEELNRDIPPFGATRTEKEIQNLIKGSVGEKGARFDAGQPLPGRFPNFNHAPDWGDNNFDDIEVVGLWIANRDLIGTLTNYNRGKLREKLEALMQEENALPMKLLLASEAAPLGSEPAALFLLKCMTNTDYQVAQNTDTAIRFALNHYEENPPDWLVKMAMATLSDERYVTGLQKSGMSSDTFFTMSYLADEHGRLTDALGYLKCTNAVPFLIGMAKKTNGRRGPVMALGALGDARAIPALIEFVKQKGPSVKPENGSPLDDGFLRPVVALGSLHAKEAIPVLLEYVEHPDVIEALEKIGDPSVLGPLEKLIATKGKWEKVGVKNDPEDQQRRLVAARIAVASLDPKDRTAKLCELLHDTSFDQYQRRSVVWRLGDHPDPRAIPFLEKAIKTDSSGAVVNQSITVLAAFKYKTAVDTLIASFNADFNGKRDWKRAYNPEMFRQNIADSLSRLTGQNFGADKQRWLTWWKENRATTSGLE
jgi:HEAT repeat protein